MKKIFAIALALVMVFSMASAFALSDCDARVYAWGCLTENTYCGTAKVEVVPYVHVNTECNDDEFVVSTCAGAVTGENLYWAVKLTVDAYPYEPWFNYGHVDLETAGINGYDYEYEDDADELPIDADAGIDMDADEEEVYYWVEDEWVNVDEIDEFVVGMPLFQATTAAEAKKVEFCANLVSEYDGYSDINAVGDYDVYFYVASGTDAIRPVTEDDFDEGNFTGFMRVDNGKDFEDCAYKFVEYVVDGGEIMVVAQGTKGFAAEVAAKLNLGCGLDVCVNEDNIKANFGWDDEQESCFPWSKSAMAIVNPECVVAIPKTGDVSVVAYAVMAVVAAAGAMLKK